MKHWPLRLKIALWSVLIVALAMLAFAVGAAWHSYEEDVELIDHVLNEQVRDIFADLKHYGDHFDWQSAPSVQTVLPTAWNRHRLEIYRDGKTFFRSEKLHGHSLGPTVLPTGDYSIESEGWPLRVAVAKKKQWEVRVAAPMIEPKHSLFELSRGFLLALPLVLLVTAVGGWWIARRALAPVAAITETAERITANKLDQRLPVPPHRDEIQHLTVVLNGMIDRLEGSLLQAMRFSADASHELRTPLTVMRAALEDALVRGHLPADRQEKLLLDLLDETTQLSAISAKLLLLSRADAGRLDLDLQSTDFSQLVCEAVEEAEIIAADSQIEVKASVQPDITVVVDGPRVLQVLRNLLENAIKYNRNGGEVCVEMEGDPQRVRVSVRNTGEGLSQKHAAHVFERFYRAEEHRSSSGHGLGLSIAREIARAHGGDVTLVDIDKESTTFEFLLPRGCVSESSSVGIHAGARATLSVTNT